MDAAQFFVYKLINKITGGIYIGYTHKRRLSKKYYFKRWEEHVGGKDLYNNSRKTLIHCAISKYGWDNFDKCILEYCNSKQDALYIEGFYIKNFNTLHPLGYNLASMENGKIVFHKETRQKLGKSIQGYKKNSGKFTGVKKNKNGTFKCTVHINLKEHSKNFNSETEAAQAYDKMVLFIYSPQAKLNLPERRAVYMKSDLKEHFDEFVSWNCLKIKNKTSRFKGVYFCKNQKNWEAKVPRPGVVKGFVLGYFDDEEDAAKIRDEFVLFWKIKTTLNFPESIVNYKFEKTVEKLKQIEHYKNNPPQYGSVWFDSKNKKWCAVGFFGGKKVWLGRFDTKQEAIGVQQRFCLTGEKTALHNRTKIAEYTGITYDRNRQKWRSRIKIKGKERFLGRFDTQEQARIIRENLEKNQLCQTK